MALSTLNRHLKKQRQQEHRDADGVGRGPLVEVELATAVSPIGTGDQPGSLTVLLSNGRRVEICFGVDQVVPARYGKRLRTSLKLCGHLAISNGYATLKKCGGYKAVFGNVVLEYSRDDYISDLRNRHRAFLVWIGFSHPRKADWQSEREPLRVRRVVGLQQQILAIESISQEAIGERLQQGATLDVLWQLPEFSETRRDRSYCEPGHVPILNGGYLPPRS
jgi:hypothetical protein